MTRHALTALATAAAYVIGWKSASAWWGRCASECRRGASNGAGLVSVDPRVVSGRQTGAERLADRDCPPGPPSPGGRRHCRYCMVSHRPQDCPALSGAAA